MPARTGQREAGGLADMSVGPTPTGDWTLLVRRGRTAAALIPVRGRTLVGSSAHCGVRLSDGLPPVHSVLVPGEEGVRVECLHPEPWLLVGDTPARTAELREGDTFSLHGVMLTLSRRAAVRSRPAGQPAILRARRPAGVGARLTRSLRADEPSPLRKAA